MFCKQMQIYRGIQKFCKLMQISIGNPKVLQANANFLGECKHFANKCKLLRETQKYCKPMQKH